MGRIYSGDIGLLDKLEHKVLLRVCLDFFSVLRQQFLLFYLSLGELPVTHLGLHVVLAEPVVVQCVGVHLHERSRLKNRLLGGCEARSFVGSVIIGCFKLVQRLKLVLEIIVFYLSYTGWGKALHLLLLFFFACQDRLKTDVFRERIKLLFLIDHELRRVSFMLAGQDIRVELFTGLSVSI